MPIFFACCDEKIRSALYSLYTMCTHNKHAAGFVCSANFRRLGCREFLFFDTVLLGENLCQLLGQLSSLDLRDGQKQQSTKESAQLKYLKKSPKM